ncbi:hypothetical protein [Paenibacillus planticolens]|uniref:Uncharacterized protein n=1 Tax=Paenibacillus planticolens TaxID=2654976 RepID=A0ABX1ZJ48_9BACL|nr:hypothetical protein [Paenibacillus planticolens]NOU98788.1 hypothetical protein [Paenibacillus planticolens]
MKRIENMRINELWQYVMTKLAASGLTLFSFWTIFSIINGLNFYSVFGGMKEVSLCNILYFYSIPCSLLIDLIVRFIPSKKRLFEILLYIACGYAYFPGLAYFRDGFSLSSRELLSSFLFAGTFGAIFAMIFYSWTRIGREKWTFQYLFGVGVPLLLLISMTIVNNLKLNWVETYTATTYEAAFDLFNGSKEVPINVRKGQTLIFKINWDTRGGSSTGQHVIKPSGTYAGMKEAIEHKSSVNIDEDGIYKIVAVGEGGLKGRFKVTWEIID